MLRTEDLEVVTEIRQPGHPDLVVMANDETKVYVSNRRANPVTVIGLSGHREIKRIPRRQGPAQDGALTAGSPVARPGSPAL